MVLFKIALIAVCAASVLCNRDVEVKTEEDLGVKYASRCEVCKVLATELQSRLEETGKVHDVIEIGYSLDDVQPKKKKKYQKSELRLIESLDGVCERILEYNIHKEREDSTRFAKGMSQTFKTLHGLVDKGVKVDLGIPYELWDKPSAEITHMKTQCESLLEDNEEAIEYWYWNLQGTKDLKLHLCSDHALRGTDNSCLFEDNVKGDQEGNKNSKLKKDESKSSKTKNEQKSKQTDSIQKVERDSDKEFLNGDSSDPTIELAEEGLSNGPVAEEVDTNQNRGDKGESYWTEPTKYVKKQHERKMQDKLNEDKMAEPDINEQMWDQDEKHESDRDEL